MRQWLKNKRHEKKYTQQKMADLMGISRQQYSFIEKGERQADLTLSTATKISNIFNISLDCIKQMEEIEANAGG